MNISICITVLNEEGSVGSLLDSLLNQTKKADQIIIVDGGSKDRTIEIIRHYQKKDGRIKLLVEKCSRARGRNLACEIAKSEIVAMTDAGCTAQKDWMEKLTGPFATGRVDVSAGFYRMTGSNPVSRAMKAFLGTKPSKFNIDFLPSTRSIAFKKEIWEQVGGFPEKLEGAAEDTVFNYKLVKSGVRISRVKDAVVEWGMPDSISKFQFSIYNYAKGDARSGIWFFPGKGLASHNIKALFIILRYLVGLSLLIFSFKYHYLFAYLLICLFAYVIRAFKKAGYWGIALQFVSDFGVMKGFLEGILGW